MQNSLRLGLATERDIEPLVALVNSAYRGESGRKGWTTESDLLSGQRIDSELLKQAMGQADSVILVARPAEPSQELIGCVHLQRKNPDEAYLGMLTVSPLRQKSGIGDYLVAEAESYVAKTWSVKVMTMTVISARAELIRWYERRGYERTGESQPFPYGNERFGIPLRNDLEFAVLKKPLTA